MRRDLSNDIVWHICYELAGATTMPHGGNQHTDPDSNFIFKYLRPQILANKFRLIVIH